MYTTHFVSLFLVALCFFFLYSYCVCVVFVIVVFFALAWKERRHRGGQGSQRWPLYINVDGAFQVDGSSIFDFGSYRQYSSWSGWIDYCSALFSSTLAICRFDIMYDWFEV